MGIKGFAKQVLTERENRRYEEELQSRKVSYGDWIAGVERQDEQGAAECQKEMQDGGYEFVIICAGEGALSAGACAYLEEYFGSHPEVQLAYGDEDVCDGIRKGEAVDGRRRHMPWFKPDWSPDLLDTFFYFGSVVAVRKSLWESGLGAWKSIGSHAGEKSQTFLQAVSDNITGTDTAGVCTVGRNITDDRTAGLNAVGAGTAKAVGLDAVGTGTDILQNIDIYEVVNFAEYEKWVRMCVMLAGGYQVGSCVVGHIQKILFHCTNVAEQEKFLQGAPYYEACMEEQIQEFRNHYGILEQNQGFKNHHGTPGQNQESGNHMKKAPDNPVISIVIPSKDQPEILGKCIEGCILAAGVVPFEIIIVDNGSSRENQQKIRELAEQKSDACPGQMTYLYEPQEFNFSRMCNQGAKQAKGEFLLFLNDDVELCLAGSMEKMAALAERACTGAVGIKLYYPDSVRIQHAGITNLPMGPVHKLQFLEDDKSYYYGANKGRRNVLAVTAACLLVEKDKYIEAGGFSEELKVAFNDVDFCFWLYELGYRNVCMNDLYGYHHESLSRGADESAEKLSRLLREREKLYARHPALEGTDPYYSPCLSHEELDTGIRPAYLTAGNHVQRGADKLAVVPLAKYRQDNCLMVRVEDCRGRRAVGYGVVLGDNNACYEKRLLLWKMQDAGTTAQNADGGQGAEEPGTDAIIYGIKLVRQYRPDLEENMSDQVNVALSGFCVELGENAVPVGIYRLGMAVRNKVTGLRLVNWSNRAVSLGRNLGNSVAK